jgi:hypothetical protein
VLRDPALKLDIEAEKSALNQFGIYHDTYRRDGKGRTHCYYLCDPGNECVLNPPVGKKWYDTVPKTFDEEIQALERASRNQQQRELPVDVIDLVSKAKSLVRERDKLENEEREAKRRCLVASTDSCEESSNFTVIFTLEDCADVVKTLYSQYDFLFLFDHSCGHDRMPDDALKVEGMNKGYGGEQNVMRASTIYCRWSLVHMHAS